MLGETKSPVDSITLNQEKTVSVENNRNFCWVIKEYNDAYSSTATLK